MAMKLYGATGKLIKGQTLTAVPCPHCGNGVHGSFGILRYFHICRIPIFPLAKTVGLECVNCRWLLLDRQIPAALRTALTHRLFDRKSQLPIAEESLNGV